MRIRDYEIRRNWKIDYVVKNGIICGIINMGILYHCSLPKDIETWICFNFGLRSYLCDSVTMMSVWDE